MTETFEKFAKDHGMDLAVIKTVEGPLYSDCNTDYAWLAWQASRQQALTEAAGYAECYDLGTPEGHAIGAAIRSLSHPTGGKE